MRAVRSGLLAVCALLLTTGVLLMAAFPGKAHANVSCGQDTQGIDFGGASTGVGTIRFTCTNYNTTEVQFTLCIGIGTPNYPGTASQPVMQGPSPDGLAFNLYRDAALSDVWTTTSPITQSVSIPAGIGTTTSGTFTFYGGIAGGQSAAAGAYSGQFYNTVLGFVPSGGGVCQPTADPDLAGAEFSLDVGATVENNCTVTALGPADLGIVPSSATDVTGSTTIRVDCPSGTPFTIGLAPSGGNRSGLGVLTGSAGNAEAPAYELHTGSPAGPLWGDTATLGSVGNGLGGTGTGAAQDFTVYVDLPDANFRPDTYTDTVTVHVNY